MTKDEIVDLLCDKGIVSEIAGSYHLTEKYKELLAYEGKRIVTPVIPKTPTELNYEELLNSKTNGQDWPSEILECKGRERAVALMFYCEVPAMAKNGTYRLRGLSNDAVNVLGNIVDSPDIDPKTMLEAITLYYKHMEMPKSFKNFILEGDILDVYNEHIKGELKSALTDTPNDSNQWH